MRHKEFARALIWCWLLGVAFFGIRWGAAGTPEPRRGKGARLGASHPWYWRELPQGLAISPDGKWLGACLLRSDRWGPRIWTALWLLNLSSGEARLINPGELPETRCAAFSADSKTVALCEIAETVIVPPLVLAGGEDYAVQLWDVATGRELPGFMRRGWVDWIAFSPDGKLLAAARYAGLFPPFPAPWYEPRTLVHLWERQGGQPLKLSTSYHFEVGGLAFSPDSIRLAVANSKHISLIDVRERQEVYRFRCRAWSSRPSFSPDGKFIAAGDRHGTIYLWDVDTGKERPVNPSRTACPGTVVFSPVGDILAAGGDGTNTIHFWDASSGREVKSLSFPQGAPCPFFFTPDGRALVGGGAEATPVVHMWDAETGKELQRWDLTPFLEQGKR